MNLKIQKVLLAIKNNSCNCQGFDEGVINSLFEYAKQYLEVLEILGYIDDNNLEIIENVLKKVRFILPYRFYMHETNNMILIDVDKSSDTSLTVKEKVMLNTYQKIGEYILTSMHYHNIQIESLVMCKGVTTNVPDMINGFSFLIKSLSQELAEQVLSYITGKYRVTRVINHSTILENGIETDFHMNEDYQEPARLFTGILLEDDKKNAFYELSQICLTKDFIEFIASSQIEEIDTLLIGLGFIKREVEENNFDYNALLAMDMLENSYNKLVRTPVLKKH